MISQLAFLVAANVQKHLPLHSMQCTGEQPYYDPEAGLCTADCGVIDGPVSIDTNGWCVRECLRPQYKIGPILLCVSCTEPYPYFKDDIMECTSDCLQTDVIVNKNNICLDECAGVYTIDPVTQVKRCVQCRDVEGKYMYYDRARGECVEKCASGIYNKNNRCLDTCAGILYNSSECVPCPSQTPFYDTTAEKCVSECPMKLANEDLTCISECAGQTVNTTVHGHFFRKCIVCTQGVPYYNLSRQSCVEQCVHNEYNVCIDHCYGTIDHDDMQCTPCELSSLFDNRTEKCEVACHEYELHVGDSRVCVEKCPQKAVDGTKLCVQCDATTPFHDISTGSCLSECHAGMAVDGNLNCIENELNMPVMPMKLQISRTHTVRYNMIVEACPAGVHNGVCDQCSYPTPYYDPETKKCVARCANVENIIDSNGFCVSTCNDYVYANHELYKGYNSTICTRFCPTGSHSGHECTPCKGVIEDNECKAVCTDDASAYVDQNQNCISDGCTDGIIVSMKNENYCLPECLFYDGNNKITCLTECSADSLIVNANNQRICRTDTSVHYKYTESWPRTYPQLTPLDPDEECSALTVNGICIDGLTKCGDYAGRGKGAEKYRYQYNNECVAECPAQYYINDTDHCVESCGDYNVTLDKLSRCVTNCKKYDMYINTKRKECVEGCGEHQVYEEVSGDRRCVQCQDAEKIDNNVCVTTCPAERPFSSGGMCVQQCQYADGNMNCVNECPHYSIENVDGGAANYTKCVDSCKGEGYKVANNILKVCVKSCNGTISESIDGEDVCTTCNDDNFIEGGTCVASCSQNNPYSHNRVCYRACSDISLPLFIEENKTCVSSCGDGLFEDTNRGACVGKCPLFRNTGNKCVDRCDGSNNLVNEDLVCIQACDAFLIQRNISDGKVEYHICSQKCENFVASGYEVAPKCVDKCKDNEGYYIFQSTKYCSTCSTLEPKQYLDTQEGRCVPECPQHLKQLGHTCVEQCYGAAYLVDESTRECVSTCANQGENKYISVNGTHCVSDCAPHGYKTDKNRGLVCVPSQNSMVAIIVPLCVVLGLLLIAVALFLTFYFLHKKGKFQSRCLDKLAATRRCAGVKARSNLDGRNYKNTQYYAQKVKQCVNNV